MFQVSPEPSTFTPGRSRREYRSAATLSARSRPPRRTRVARPPARDIPALVSSHPSGHPRRALRSAMTGPRAVWAAWCGGDGRRRGVRSGAPDGRHPTAAREVWPPPIPARELQQRSRQESADCVFGDLPVDPVVVVAVSPEKRRSEVEDMLAPYHERRVQPRADRRLGVAREVLPGPVEEGAAQFAVRRGAFERANQVRPVVVNVVVVRGELGLSRERLVEPQVTRHRRGLTFVGDRDVPEAELARLPVQTRRPTEDDSASGGHKVLQLRAESPVYGDPVGEHEGSVILEGAVWGVYDVELDRRLQEELRGALHIGDVRVCGDTSEGRGLVAREDGHLGGGAGPSQERFQHLHPAEGMLEEAVDCGIEDTPGVELISDGDLAPGGDDGTAFVVELVAGLQAAEVGPGLVEAPRHPQVVDPVSTGLPRHDGVVQVSPQSRRGRQTLYLEVGLEGERLGHPRVDRTVVEDSRAGDLRADRLAQPPEEAFQLLFGET